MWNIALESYNTIHPVLSIGESLIFKGKNPDFLAEAVGGGRLSAFNILGFQCPDNRLGERFSQVWFMSLFDANRAFMA